MTDKNAARQAIFQEIRDGGGKVTEATTPYRILYRLAKVKGIEMNGSAVRIAKLCGVKQSVISVKAKQIMWDYVETGYLKIPQEFQMRGRLM